MSGAKSDPECEIEILEIVGLEEDGGAAESAEEAPASDAQASRRHTRALLQGAQRDGRIHVLRALLPGLDDLEGCMRKEASPEEVVRVVRMSLRSLWDVFRGHELERIEGDACAFDPRIHEAVSMTRTDRVPPGRVLEVLRVGYRLDGELVRPAMVRVSAPSNASDGDEPAAEVGDSEEED